MTRDVHDVIIVGAGQGGLSVSYFLARENIDHKVVDRGGIAHAWKAHRWDSFCLVTPNWTVNLPGLPYAGDDPDGFMLRDDFVAYLTKWARKFKCPVIGEVDVKRIRKNGNVFELSTSAGLMLARRVVVATATYQHPKTPAVANQFPAQIRQLHAEDYKKPDQARDGAVLVVGSGQTGCQIVEDYLRAGREVYLCVAQTGRLPRRYRGRDSLYWQRDMGLLDRTPDMLEKPELRFVGDPHLTGRDGGATVSLYRFQRRGVTLLGRLTGVQDSKITLLDDLQANLEFADDFADNFMRTVDAYIDNHGISAPEPTAAELAGGLNSDDDEIQIVSTVDLQDANINTVIWATGFTYDFSWIDDLKTDAQGYPVMHDGAGSLDGLYFCGLNWMTRRKSGILYGVEEDAKLVADQLSYAVAAATVS